MRVQVCYHEGGGTYTFDAPEGTNVGDVMSENEDGTGKRIEVVRIGSDYEGKVRQLWPHADPERESFDGTDAFDGDEEPTPQERQAAVIATLRETGLMGDATDAEVWQAAVRVGERHGAGTALRDPAAVARELGRVEDIL